jgi:hypothetical protein
VRTVLIATVTATLLFAGCGGDSDDDLGVKPLPAAGSLTPAANTPGVPTGATYDLDGNGYLALTARETVIAAKDFVKDHPKDCEGADPGRVAAYAYTSIGTDFPLTSPAADALTEGCAADLQS